ncbi:integrin beta-1-like [Coregonus clupeaformis]|uniref:integrin beta-1-like n=1 Tax=Coregonus clupeaformis TaxID=59861 RepID=UPI001E1C7AD4|nr:integrin beta-1-like [Coregonus clupeaformis]
MEISSLQFEEMINRLEKGGGTQSNVGALNGKKIPSSIGAKGQRRQEECYGQGVKSCGECLASGPHCAWCKEESFIEPGQHTWEHCDTARALLERGCLVEHLENPRGSTVLLENQKEDIDWRNVTHLLMFSTDAGFHFAGDGKLRGIVLPNDGKCHLENNVYARCHLQDYPSVTHLAEKLREKNIQIIFAVTEDVTYLYEGLKSTFPKSAVGTLSNNFQNILRIIVEAYNALTSDVVMEKSELPADFQISYISHCKNNDEELLEREDQGRRCSNISIGDELKFNGTISVPPCLSGTSMGQSRVVIKPQEYGEELEVLLKPIHDCPCQRDRVPHSPGCSHSNGTLECGVCSGLVSAGRGVCSCGACLCQDGRYQGPTCDLCPTCTSACTLHRPLSL